MSLSSSKTNLVLLPILLDDLQSGETFLQTQFWAEFKRVSFWTPRAFSWEFNGDEGQILVLERKILGFFPLAYIPCGPQIPSHLDARGQTQLLSSLSRKLLTELSPSCFLIRFDLTHGLGGVLGSLEEKTHPRPLLSPLRRAPHSIQPSDTVMVNLQKSEEEILAAMHKKTRYNIRLASKKGVLVDKVAKEKIHTILPEWYALYQQTAKRDKITLHSEEYYQRLFDGNNDENSPQVTLYMARKGLEVLAGIIVIRWKKRVTYLYGASGDEKRELMPNYLLQWTAMRDARAASADEYDFFGIPPVKGSAHPMQGLWRFKTGFGGHILHYLGTWDYPVSWIIYAFYRLAEVLRRKKLVLSKKKKNKKKGAPIKK